MSDKRAIEGLLVTPELAELGPGPRPGIQPEAALTRAVEAGLAGRKLASERQQLVRALVLLWHDHLDTAHRLAQEIENADGAFVHGIMHRREPDYGNAAYWFRRVGGHGAFPALAKRTAGLLDAGEKELLAELVRDGEWDPFGFIRACERAAGRPATEPQTRQLRAVQEAESVTLLEWLLR